MYYKLGPVLNCSARTTGRATWGAANINGCPAITELATKLQDLANVQITEGNMYIQTGLTTA